MNKSEKEQTIALLEKRLEKLKRDEPYATIPIAALERVIELLESED